MRSIIFSALIVVSVSAFGWWGYQEVVDNCYTSDFYLNTWPEVHPSSISSETKREVKTILKQPFTYLGKGRQFFVFESADKKWVLKFMKCQRVNVSPWYEAIWLPHFLDEMRKTRLQAKKLRVERTFKSLQLAAGELSDLTGVVYVHLKPMPELEMKVVLINRLGFAEEIDIDKVPCVLQRKAEYVFPVLEELYVQNDTEALKERLDQLLTLFVALATRNVRDIDDGAFLRDNIAFLPDRAIYVDVGTFVADVKALGKLETDLKRLEPVVTWLQAKEPKLAEQFAQEVANKPKGGAESL